MTVHNLLRQASHFLLLCAAAAAQSISGTVTNKTNNKPAAGDDVVLLKLAQGMQELARTKSDSHGKFHHRRPRVRPPSPPRHPTNKANYFQPVQPGESSSPSRSTPPPPPLKASPLTPTSSASRPTPPAPPLRVTEHFFLKNASEPATTLMSEHPFELNLPPGATVEGAAAKAPGGMAVQSGLVPETEPNRFTIIFPIRPGETEFQVTYKLPYDPRPATPSSPAPSAPRTISSSCSPNPSTSSPPPAPPTSRSLKR